MKPISRIDFFKKLQIFKGALHNRGYTLCRFQHREPTALWRAHSPSMKAVFDNGDDFTSRAIRAALRGEVVTTFVDPELLREAEDFLKNKGLKSSIAERIVNESSSERVSTN